MSPDIRILQLLPGARQASGAVVVLDVFRAFTTACAAFHQGARQILAVETLDLARSLHHSLPGSLLIGERDGLPPQDFHFGNSPTEILSADLSGQTLIQTTSAGTRCLAAAAPNASILLAASFVNAEATVQYLLAQRPRTISIVCSGNSALTPATEDTACAQWLAARLSGHRPDFNPVLESLRCSLEAQRFLNPEKQIAPASDFDLCTQINRFPFALLATPLPNGACRLQPVQPPPANRAP